MKSKLPEILFAVRSSEVIVLRSGVFVCVCVGMRVGRKEGRKEVKKEGLREKMRK